ncbi:MAG: hypothetical protein M3O35_22300 [Acidobacteriota bacterium]|nr:hypothetical protein [Acidobacteriota bacterium]
MRSLSFADIEKEFDESLGYIRNDIAELRRLNCSLNYTVALLVGCACEVLASCGVERRHDYQIFAELLPEGDWRLLAKPLFNALRNGLAHGFDTKHLHVGKEAIQIYISWSEKNVISIREATGADGLFIGIQPLAERLCARINEFRAKLQSDEVARHQFRRASQRERTAQCSQSETEAWRRLAALIA